MKTKAWAIVDEKSRIGVDRLFSRDYWQQHSSLAIYKTKKEAEWTMENQLPSLRDSTYKIIQVTIH